MVAPPPTNNPQNFWVAYGAPWWKNANGVVCNKPRPIFDPYQLPVFSMYKKIREYANCKFAERGWDIQMPSFVTLTIPIYGLLHWKKFVKELLAAETGAPKPTETVSQPTIQSNFGSGGVSVKGSNSWSIKKSNKPNPKYAPNWVTHPTTNTIAPNQITPQVDPSTTRVKDDNGNLVIPSNPGNVTDTAITTAESSPSLTKYVLIGVAVIGAVVIGKMLFYRKK